MEEMGFDDWLIVGEKIKSYRSNKNSYNLCIVC